MIPALFGLLLAACSGARVHAIEGTKEEEPSPLPEWRRGVFPPPEWQKPAAPPLPEPPDVASLASFAREIEEVCPAAAEGAPSPGLSPPARAMSEPRGCIYRPLTWEEIATIERILKVTAREAPDRPRILDRLAADYFLVEKELYRECLKLSVLEPPSRKELEERRAKLRRIREYLPNVRARGIERCAQLAAEHPSYTPGTPCSER